jgi:cytochrome c-type biogenesis protein CcmH
MALWVLFALMTVAAIFAVLWPLSRRGVGSGGSDIAVYRDQLEEITRDRSAGLIGEAEAEAARVEVSRRLLAAADAAEMEPSLVDPPLWRRRAAAIVALVVLPAGAIALYLLLGSPQMPGAPLAARQAATENRSIESMIAQVEDHAARNPNDGRAWEVLAPVYMRLGRFEDSIAAWRNAIRLNGSTVSREADLGEALVAAQNGVVTAEAKAAFDRALALDREDAKARFYIGLAAEQDGRRAEAETIWRDLLAKAPPGAPWVPVVRRALEQNAPGPSSADVAAAQKLAPDQQNEMISSMVSRLAERLKENGSDVEGWLRLLRAYTVLGERDKAQSALADARRALAGEPEKIRRIDELVKELGLQG